VGEGGLAAFLLDFRVQRLAGGPFQVFLRQFVEKAARFPALQFAVAFAVGAIAQSQMLPGAGDQLQGLKKGVVELADMIAVNKADGDNIARATSAAAEYRAALKNNIRLTRDEGIDAVMKKHKLDALVGPTGGPAWVTDLVNGDHYLGSSATPAAVAGYPSVTVPAGTAFGLPVGVSFFSTAWTEQTLIKFAFAFEQATKQRQAPSLRPAVAFDAPAKK
jgi:hypothetical protein